MSTFETCRLCGLSCEQSLDIFDRLSCVNMLQYKIKQLLDIAVGRNDSLPHSVCLLCVHKLDSLWCFKNACQQVQIKLRKMRGLDRSNDADCFRLQSKRGLSNIVISGFRSHENDSSRSRPSHHGKELDIQSPSTSKSSCSTDLLGNNECSDDVSKQKSTTTNIASIPLAAYLEMDYHNQVGEAHSDSHLHSISNDSETTLIHTRDIDNNSDYEDDDDNAYNGIIEEDDDSMCIVSGEKIEAECSVDISSTSIAKVTEDNIICSKSLSCAQEQNDENTRNSSEVSSLSATTGSKIVKSFEGHFYRIETNSNSDLLCNRIPYLLVKSEMGTKHMIYTISPDLSKFDNEHNHMLDDRPTGYLTLETFDLENPNVIRTLIEWLNNLLKGEISLMPYYFSWLDSKNQLNLGFKCILCKRCIVGIKKQIVINHIADHLLWVCPECGQLCRCLTRFNDHLRQLKHESPTFECSACGEKFGSDFDKYKVHKRGHYKFECLSCRFECSDEEKWLKHLKEDRKKVESCSSDCCLFYESIDEFRNHVSVLATVGGYVCGACGMAYHCEEYLRLHLRVHGLEHGSKRCEAELSGSAVSENKVTNFQKKLDCFKYANELTHFATLKKILDNEIDSKEFQTPSTAVGGRVYTGFTCFKCSRVVQSEKKFRFHIENHFMMTCQCKKYLSGIHSLGKHFQRCSFQRRMCVSCRNNVWLNTSKEYIEHLSLHQKRRICIYCQEVFANPEKLERHIDSSHHTENGKHWFCEHCNESLAVVSYKSLDAFKLNHFKERHPDKLESFICEICGKTYISKISLANHTKSCCSANKNIDTFICAYCNKEFLRKASLQRHIDQHLNDNNYKCGICEKVYKRESSMYKHKMDVHSVKKHVCHVCKKRFTFASALKDHMKRARHLVERLSSY